MRPRYVVQVIDEPPSAPPPASSPTQPLASQPVLVTGQGSSPPSEPEKFVVQSRLRVHTQTHTAAATSSVPDLFSRTDEVTELLQQSQVEDVREKPVVQTPVLPKRVKNEHFKRSPESQFVDQLRHTQNHEKIERFYQQHHDSTPPPVKKKNSSSSGWRSFGVPWPQVRFAPSGIMVFLIVAGILTSVGAVSAWTIQRDLLDTKTTIQSLMHDVEEGQMASVRDRIAVLRKKQLRYAWLLSKTRPAFRLTLGEEKTTAMDKSMVLADSSLDIAESGLAAYDQFHKGYQQFLGKSEGDAIATLQDASGDLEALFAQLSGLQAEVQQFENPFHWEVVPEVQKRVGESLPTLRRGVLAAQQITDALPELMGANGKRTYLVLLQNNAELRPTGGFIGSFGLLTVDQGRFVDFTVEDVYEADGQLNGYVEPPPEIVEHLGEAVWYMRDVNWSPDFPTVAEQAKWFLNKEIRVKADGVIGVNLAVAQKLLEVTGPVKLVDYGDEVITKDNLYQRAQMHAEINFFPGSNQKRDFLSAVTNQLYLRLTEGEVNEASLLRVLYESAEEAQLLVAMGEPRASQAFSTLGWTGALRTPDCPPIFQGKTCLVDTVMQVEANLGVNKANQFVQRSIDHTARISGSTVTHTRVTTIQNTSTSNAWPEGAYKAYFRFFVPAQNELVGVKVNGQIVPLQNVRITDEQGKRSYGFLVNTPVQSTSIVEIQYREPLPTTGPMVYTLFEQKQSGTMNDKVVHHIQVDGRKVTAVAPEPDDQRGGFSFNSNRSRHAFYAVEIE